MGHEDECVLVARPRKSRVEANIAYSDGEGVVVRSIFDRVHCWAPHGKEWLIRQRPVMTSVFVRSHVHRIFHGVV